MSVDTAERPDVQERSPLLGTELRVRRVIAETAEAVSIEFEPDAAFEYEPGQYLTLRVPCATVDGGAVGRSYSLSSSPHIDSNLRITVKRVADGVGSNWLCDNTEAGTVLRVLPPAGTFVLDRAAAGHLFFAAGSGITPVISMLKSALARTDAPLFLFYVNRAGDSVIFREELDALSAQYGDRLTIVHWLTGKRGRPGNTQIAELLPKLSGEEVAYLCGPAPFAETVGEALAGAGLTELRMRTEAFTSLTGDPFRLETAEVGDTAAISLTVDLDGDVESIACPAETPLLDAMLAAGIDPPYSCREGTCGTCIAQLTEGKVEHRSCLALAPDEVEDGYILPCQAIARSTVVAVEF